MIWLTTNCWLRRIVFCAWPSSRSAAWLLVWKVWMRACSAASGWPPCGMRVDRRLDRLALGAERSQQLVLARLIGRALGVELGGRGDALRAGGGDPVPVDHGDHRGGKLLRLGGDRGGQSERGKCRAEEKSVH